ncbi:hypothetical protein OH77DRAFT_939569 [Trametes cingulata]|nr:hypothetical protein OH77DRAFT_939569 [Trametes cingulata]
MTPGQHGELQRLHALRPVPVLHTRFSVLCSTSSASPQASPVDGTLVDERPPPVARASRIREIQRIHFYESTSRSSSSSSIPIATKAGSIVLKGPQSRCSKLRQKATTVALTGISILGYICDARLVTTTKGDNSGRSPFSALWHPALSVRLLKSVTVQLRLPPTELTLPSSPGHGARLQQDRPAKI